MQWASASRAVGGGPSGGGRAAVATDGSDHFKAKPPDGCQGLALQCLCGCLRYALSTPYAIHTRSMIVLRTC